MTEDHEGMVSRALRELPVPDHGPTFWRDLEARLAASEAPAAPTGISSPAVVRNPEDGSDEPVPVVAELAERVRRRSAPWIASIAAALVLIVAVTVTLSGDPQPERVRIADPATDGTEVSTPAVPTTTQTTPPAPATDATATPEAALLAWITAVADGDTATAAALTGPRSKAYADAITGGAGINGFLLEAGEGYGAWAGSPDRSTTEVDLDTTGEDITIVVMSGTWTGEGGTGPRTDAIPVVRSNDGSWLVEPWAIEPATGGRLTVLSPGAAGEAGFGGLAPDAALAASAPGAGTFHFALDDQPPTRVTGQKTSDGVRATFDPPGSMASRTHLLVVAYVDGQTISAVAGTFTVEG